MNSEKFAPLAILPVGEGQGHEAAVELQRCVTKMKFVGGVVALSRGCTAVFGDKSYEELWSTAEKLHVPIVQRDMFPKGNEVR